VNINSHILNRIDSEKLSDRILLLQELTNGLFLITQSLFENKVKIEYHQMELEGKLHRFGIGNHSIIKLLEGTNYKLIETDISAIDIFSIYSIMRQQIESFIILFYLIFDTVDDSEKDFRYDVYKLHGLLKQSKYKAHSEATIALKNEILNDIKAIKINIENTSIFKSASKKEQTQYLNPTRPKLEKPENLFRKSGIKQIRLLDVWNLYSNYAHSEHISDRQYNSFFKKNESMNNMLLSVLNQCSELTTKLIRFMADSFEAAELTLEKMDNEVRVQVKVWEDIIEKRVLQN
jgi:hypothetical protein